MGEGCPVAIQTMWKDKLSDQDIRGEGAKKTITRIEKLNRMGCRLLRFAVPDIESAERLGKLAAMTHMPLVADIHFDYKIALRCLDFPIAKIRINPGNIGSKEKAAQVLNKCADKQVPIRIGVNAGSLSADLRNEVLSGALSKAEALVRSAERELDFFDECNFSDVVVSMKASSARETIEANTLFASSHQIPLHIGVTEAGPLIAGVVRNTAALYHLLCQGTGDTIRVSLSDTMENEVIAAREILLAVDDHLGELSPQKGHTLCGPDKAAAHRAREASVRIISCPRCGRAGFDTHQFTEKRQDELYQLKKNISIAIMGCAVNGPGEARDADLGITGAGDKVLLFKKGTITHSIDRADADRAFREALSDYE
jgi:(E)-4-hydroxy-3-methylbut-2-enyl-diphosphate synthase